jgi:hypothetical protein
MLNKFNNMRFSFFLEEQDRVSKVSNYLDEKKYTFFFEYEKDLYAAEEDSRLVFAKMKHEDEDLPADWRTELKFSATKVIPELIGEEPARYFGFKNLKNIKNIDREEVINKIIKSKNYNDFRFQ